MEEVKVKDQEEREVNNSLLLTLGELLATTVPNESEVFTSIWTQKEAQEIKNKILEIIRTL